MRTQPDIYISSFLSLRILSICITFFFVSVFIYIVGPWGLEEGSTIVGLPRGYRVWPYVLEKALAVTAFAMFVCIPIYIILNSFQSLEIRDGNVISKTLFRKNIVIPMSDISDIEYTKRMLFLSDTPSIVLKGNNRQSLIKIVPIFPNMNKFIDCLYCNITKHDVPLFPHELEVDHGAKYFLLFSCFIILAIAMALLFLGHLLLSIPVGFLFFYSAYKQMKVFRKIIFSKKQMKLFKGVKASTIPYRMITAISIDNSLRLVLLVNNKTIIITPSGVSYFKLRETLGSIKRRYD